MKNYAVLTYEKPRKGKNANGGLTVHIERREGYSKANIDPSRTHLNRLVHGAANIDEAVERRIAEAHISRKIRADAVRFVQVILSGTPPHINDVLDDPVLGEQWIETSLQFLFDAFGEENVVNVTLHLDEHSPHLHATVVPILHTPAKDDGRKRKSGKRYKKREGAARLSAKDMFDPERSEFYQDEYAARVAKFGFERGERKAHVRRLVGEWNRKHPREEPIPLYKPKGMGVDEYYRFVHSKVGFLLGSNDAIEEADKQRRAAEQARRRMYTAVKAQVTQLRNVLGEIENVAGNNVIEDLNCLLSKADERARKLSDSVRKLSSDRELQIKYEKELAAKVAELIRRKESLENELARKSAEIEEAESAASLAKESLGALQGEVSDLAKRKEEMEAQSLARSVLSVYRVQELLYFALGMHCNEKVLSELDVLIADLKIRHGNALIELERLLIDLLLMLLSLLFGSVTHRLLHRYVEPLGKRFGLDFSGIEAGHGQSTFQYDYEEVVSYVAQEKNGSDDMMSITFKEANALIDNPEKRQSREFLTGLIARGHWESIVRNIQDSVPERADLIMDEILRTLNEPNITNAYRQRILNESEYRRKGYYR